MTPAIQKNLIGGGGLLAFGALYALYAVTQLPVGTFSNMGPGMFPLLVGCTLAITGGVIMAPAALEAAGRLKSDEPTGRWETIEIVPLLLVLLAMASFALLLEPFGVAPSVVVLVAICALASDKLGWRQIAAISAVLIASTYLIFIFALKMPLELVSWPF